MTEDQLRSLNVLKTALDECAKEYGDDVGIALEAIGIQSAKVVRYRITTGMTQTLCLGHLRDIVTLLEETSLAQHG